jgi:hypothetical protein
MGGANTHDEEERAWASLRALLSGLGPAEIDDEALGKAALTGDVAALATSLHPPLRPRLAQTLEREVFVALLLDRAMGEAARAVAAGGDPPVVLLKGTAAAHQIYESPSHRIGVDIDILVGESDFDGVLSALRGAGFQDVESPDFVRKHGARAWEHELAWVTDGSSVSVDVHRRLAASDRFEVDHEGIMARAVAVDALPWPVTHPSDTLLHTALHLAANRYAVPLKSWIDVLRLLHHPDVDLSLVVERARSWRMATALWAALKVCERWFEVALPEALLTSIQPSIARRMVLERALSGNGRWPIVGDPRGTLSRLIMGPLLSDDLGAAWAWLSESARQAKRMATIETPG